MRRFFKYWRELITFLGTALMVTFTSINSFFYSLHAAVWLVTEQGYPEWILRISFPVGIMLFIVVALAGTQYFPKLFKIFLGETLEISNEGGT